MANFEPWDVDQKAEPLTPLQFEQRMRLIYPSDEGYCEEQAHGEADALMLGLLESLGYGDGCAIFNSATQWYA